MFVVDSHFCNAHTSAVHLLITLCLLLLCDLSNTIINPTENSNEEEVAKLLKDNCYYVYQTFLDSMSAYEYNFRRGIPLPTINEFQFVF